MATMPSDSQRPWTRDRFYTIDGCQLPSVTTILDVIAKPALGPWYAKQERRYFKTADREKQRAATIGTAIHAGIEWQLRTRLGEDAGPEPVLPDAAAWAVESWKDWATGIALEPLAIERTVYCEVCGYAGTLDLYARVEGALTILDWKSGRAIYPEAFLQNVAYRHAAARQGLPAAQGLIVRLPKLLEDPAWEVMPVPKRLTLEDFLAALSLWRWQRAMAGQCAGDVPRSVPTRLEHSEHDHELIGSRAAGG